LNAALRYTTAVARRKTTDSKPRPRPAILRALGSQLRRLRLEQKLSQERLAELSGLTYKYIGRIELAKADPGADTLVRLARALRIPVGELFALITPPDNPRRLSPSDAEALASSLAALTTVITRIITNQPPPLPIRAPRRLTR
jgi:transcriptional regulator with XRE-family HTH domain